MVATMLLLNSKIIDFAWDFSQNKNNNMHFKHANYNQLLQALQLQCTDT